MEDYFFNVLNIDGIKHKRFSVLKLIFLYSIISSDINNSADICIFIRAQEFISHIARNILIKNIYIQNIHYDIIKDYKYLILHKQV